MPLKRTLQLLLTTELSNREIALKVGVSKTTVGRYRRLTTAKSVMWPDVSELPPSVLRQRFNRDPNGNKTRRVPDFAMLQERIETGVPLQILWEDYRREDPHNTLSYSQLATRMRAYRRTKPGSMMLTHTAGHEAFVDYAGCKRIPLPTYTDPSTGDKIAVQLFVGVLPASSLIFAICSPSQQVPDFIRSHVDMLAYFGGVPLAVVCDNLKSAVIKPGRRPVLQRTYEEFSRHYAVAINPARIFSPKDKAMVEGAVKIVQNHIVVRLHDRVHHSLDDLNADLANLLEDLNNRRMLTYGKSRRERFEQLERGTLNPLPVEPFVYAKCTSILRVPKDYHVRVDHHAYSVPHALTGQRVDARITDDRVDIFRETERVASHARSFERGGHTTDPDHLTVDHRAWHDRTPDAMIAWAKRAGPNVHAFIKKQLGKSHPVAALPACEEIKALAEKHGTEVVNRAAGDAMDLNVLSVSTLRRMIRKHTDQPTKPAVRRSRYTQGSKAFAKMAQEAAC